MSMSAYSPLGRLLKNTHPAGPRTAVPTPIICLPACGGAVRKYPVPLSSMTPDKHCSYQPTPFHFLPDHFRHAY